MPAHDLRLLFANELTVDPPIGVTLRLEGRTWYMVLNEGESYTFGIENSTKRIGQLAVEYTDANNSWRVKLFPLAPKRAVRYTLQPTGSGDLIIQWGEVKVTIEVRIDGMPD